MTYIPKSIKNMERHQCKVFRRDSGTTKNYQKPIVADAFMFAGPEISKKKEKDYLKAVETGFVQTGFKPVSTSLQERRLYGRIVNR